MIVIRKNIHLIDKQINFYQTQLRYAKRIRR